MADRPVLARETYGEPSHHDNAPSLPPTFPKINFRHPGYNDTENILLILPGQDHPSGGIHHETARILCAIVANNQYAGFFTEDIAGAKRVEIPEDGVLQAKNYYFRVTDNPTDRYPIVRSFRDWRFPHGGLPDYWTRLHIANAPDGRLFPRQSALTDAILVRDLTCRLTKHVESTEHAHLVPRNEQHWFNVNSMFQYTNLSRVGIDHIDDSLNGILLRSDLHTLFDQRRFAIVPKPSVDESDQLSLVVHVLIPGMSPQLTQLYHNVATQELTGVAVELLFARLAWTIFPFANGFVQTGENRVLCFWEDGKSVTREFSSEERQLFIYKSKSRSASPKKRKPETSETAAEDDIQPVVWRGRKRRRTSSLTGSLSRDRSWCTSPFNADFDTDPSDVDSKFRSRVIGKETEVVYTAQSTLKA